MELVRCMNCNAEMDAGEAGYEVCEQCDADFNDKIATTREQLQEAREILAMMKENPEATRATFGMSEIEFEDYMGVVKTEIETHERTLHDLDA